MYRSPEVVNAEIRELWADGMLAAEARERYLQLVVEWAAAMREEQQLAA
jgi:hypothetical protein